MNKRKNRVISLFLLLSIIFSLTPLSYTLAASDVEITKNEKNYIIHFKDQQKGKQKLGKKTRKINRENKYVPLTTITLSQEEVNDLQNDPNVESIEEDQIVIKTSEEFPVFLDQIHVTSKTGLPSDAVGSGIKVAILDTGLDKKSNKLKIVDGISFVPGQTDYQDISGHGTAVAGVMGALKNGEGLVGVSPSVDLYAVKVLNDSGFGTYSQIIQGIEWSIDHHVDIISMSFAGNIYSSALEKMMNVATEKGILLVAAAGNDAKNEVSYPARFSSVMAVGAVDADNNKASFSNSGNELSIVAPGINILGLGLRNGSPTVNSGTSMAVPQVVGAAAILKSKNQQLTNKQIREILETSATPLGDALQFGHGLLNVSAAWNLNPQLLPRKINGSNEPNDEDQYGINNSSSMNDSPSTLLPTNNANEKTNQEISDTFGVSLALIEGKIKEGYSREQIQIALIYRDKEGISEEEAFAKAKPSFRNNSQQIISSIVSEVPENSLNISSGFEASAASDPVEPDPNVLNAIALRTSEAPYQVSLGGEVVSTLSGGLSRKETDMSLPGRNGLSFNLTRIYNSNESQFNDPIVNSSTNYIYKVSFNSQGAIETKYYRYHIQYLKYYKEYRCDTGVEIKELSVNIGAEPWEVLGEYNTKAAATQGFFNAPSTKVADFSVCKINSKYNTNTKWRYEYIYYDKNLQEFSKIGGKSSPEQKFSESMPYSTAYSESDRLNRSPEALLNTSVWEGSDSTGYYRALIYTASVPNASVVIIPSGNSYSNGTKVPADEKRFPIGKGWKWDVAYIDKPNDKQVIHLPGSGAYEISDTSLKGYPWKDLSFLPTTTTSNIKQISVNNEVSTNVLSSISGQKYYFNATGELLQIEDNYMNTVKFYYTIDSKYGKVLQVIEDALLNRITIEYPSSSQVKLKSGDRTVTYNKEIINGKELLTQVTDQLDRKITYDYEIKNAKFDLLYANPSTDNPYALIKGVSYPTGARTIYEYELPVTRYIGSQAVNQVYRLKYRQEELIDSNNIKTYYNLTTMDYNKQDMASNYGVDSTFSTKVTRGNVTTSYDYSKDYIDSTTPTVFYNKTITSDAGTDGKKFTIQEFDEIKRQPVPKIITSYFQTESGQKSLEKKVKYVYDDFGHTTESMDVLGLVTTFTYNPSTFLLESKSVPLSDKFTLYTKYNRNAQGDPFEILVKNGATGKETMKKYVYDRDIYGNVTTTTISNSNESIVLETEYGTQYGSGFATKQSQVVHGNNNVTTTVTTSGEYNKSTGELVSLTDGETNTTKYDYDKLGRLTVITFPDKVTQKSLIYNDLKNSSESVDELGRKTRIEWNPLGWKIKSAIYEAGSYRIVGSWDYDAYGKLNWKADADGNKTTFTYDNWGRQRKTEAPQNNSESIYYDDVNLTQTTTDILGNRIKTTTDFLGRVLKKEEGKPQKEFVTLETAQYTNSGNVKQVKDAKGKLTIYDYDFFNRLESVKNAKEEITTYTYDLMDHLTTIVNPDLSTIVKKYDELGRLINETNESDLTSYSDYDNNGNRVHYLDRNGNTFSYTYTDRNQLFSQTSFDGTISFEYFPDGSRKIMTDGQDITYYTYKDFTGQLDTVTYPDKKTIKYEYDTRGNVSNVKDPFNISTAYSYDPSNRLEFVGEKDNFDAKYTYYSNGLIKNVSQNNGMFQSDYKYSGLDLEGLVQKNLTGDNLNTFKIDMYDLNKNIIKVTDNEKVQEFNYDVLNRVESTMSGKELYSYDNRGNRHTVEPQTSFKEPATYKYDSLDRLNEVVKEDGRAVRYKYNGDGLLTERTENGQIHRYYYSGDKIIAEGLVAGDTVQLIAHYTAGLSGFVTRQDSQGNKDYYLTNYHGDVVELRDSQGNLVNNYTYDLWGNITSSREDKPQPFKYSGEFWDDTTSLQYLRARWYDPKMGRFINEDTFEGQINNPLSLNLYTYVSNNPLKYTDPTGHQQMVEGTPGIGYMGENGTPSYYYTATNAILKSWGIFGEIVGYAFMDDINTIVDPNASAFDKSLAAAGFVPWGKLIRGGKLVIQMGNAEGKYIERATELTEANWKAASALVCNCFVAGTKVQTDEGEKNIEDIEVGDKVLSKNEETGEVSYKEVTATFNHETDEIYKIHVGNQTIESTFNHPFWVEGKGWTFVKDLQVGDLLVQSDGNTLKIDSIELEHKHVTVYNMTVDEFHTYFVSDLGIWVHNTGGACTPINVAESKMYQLGDHYNKHGRGMGYASKKEYDAAAKEFATANQSNPNASILEGTWNGSGSLNGARQRAITFDGKTTVIDVNTGQVVDFFVGTEYKGINIVKLQ